MLPPLKKCNRLQCKWTFEDTPKHYKRFGNFCVRCHNGVHLRSDEIKWKAIIKEMTDIHYQFNIFEWYIEDDGTYTLKV